MGNAILVGTNKDANGKFTEYGFYNGGLSEDGLREEAMERGYALPTLADGKTLDFDAMQSKASELIKK